jgi:iron complex transport system permease protein
MKDTTQNSYIVVVGSLIVLLLAALVISITAGRFSLPLPLIIEVLTAGNSRETNDSLIQAANILFIVRLPRIMLAILVGASLSLAGAAYQGIFKNPLVSPDILGVTHGAGTGAALGILLGIFTGGIQLISFCFGIGTVLIVLSLTKIFGGGRNATVILILTGTVMNAFFASIISFMKYIADADSKLPEIVFWLMGSFARSGNNRNVVIMFVIFIIAGIPLFALRWWINVLSLGEDEAKSLGVNTKMLRSIIIISATLLTAASVCFCGTIQWVGLIIPHVSRLLTGPDNRRLLPVAAILGGLFMLVVDDFARAIIPGELPVGVLTAFIGAPLFLYMLFSGKKE